MPLPLRLPLPLPSNLGMEGTPDVEVEVGDAPGDWRRGLVTILHWTGYHFPDH